MAADKDRAAGLGPKARDQVQKLVRERMRRHVNEMPQRGRWMGVPGGGDTRKVRFEIIDADCENRTAVAKILSIAGSTPEAYEITGQTEVDEDGVTVPSQFVMICDKAGCYLNESNRNLFGRIGYADYMYGRPRTNYQPWWSWEITALCEQQTDCEAF